MFRTGPLSIIGSFSLYPQQSYMSYRFAHDGQRNCPKHVEFYSKNKFEKLVHLVRFIIRILYDARSPERKKVLHNLVNIFRKCQGFVTFSNGMLLYAEPSSRAF